jgi:hypothetical protein
MAGLRPPDDPCNTVTDAPSPTNTRARSHHRKSRPLRRRPENHARGFINGGRCCGAELIPKLTDQNPSASWVVNVCAVKPDGIDSSQWVLVFNGFWYEVIGPTLLGIHPTDAETALSELTMILGKL